MKSKSEQNREPNSNQLIEGQFLKKKNKKKDI